MGTSNGKNKKTIKTIIPVNDMVLVRHDKDQETTAGGIILPDTAKIPVLTGIIIAMTENMKENRHDYPYEEGDRVVYDTRESVPYTLDPRDKHYLVHYRKILGVVKEEEIDIDDMPSGTEGGVLLS